MLVFRSAFFGVGTNEFFPDEVGTVIAVILQSEGVKQEYVRTLPRVAETKQNDY
ncbi:MAG: hypothetical protein OEM41_08305 [Ignavibacteria bacterium]|nr:hypothetical protein [Ignavibacteria bacterium]